MKGLSWFLCCALIGVLMTMGSFCNRSSTQNPMALEQQNACVQNLQVQDYDRAEIRCQICLQYDKTVPECLNGLGLVAFARGNDDSAIDYFSKALRQNNQFAQARNNLGAVYFRQGNFDRALGNFQDAVETDPGYVDARYNYGLCYLRLGQQATNQGDNARALKAYDNAETQYQSLMELAPSYTNGYRDLGLIYTYRAQLEKMQDAQDKDLAQAVNYFQQCLQIDSSSESCHESYGHTLLYQHQYSKAVDQFTQCLAANKNNGVCQQGMTAAYQGSQLKSSALQQFVDQLKQDPNNANTHYAYCVALFQNKMDQMAAGECQKALQLDSKQCLANYQLGMYYQRTLDADSALASCRSYLLCETNPANQSNVQKCQQVITTLAPGASTQSYTGNGN